MKKRLVWLVVALVLISGLVWLTPFAYSGFKIVRSNHLSSRALELYYSKPYDGPTIASAYQLALSALFLAPTRYEPHQALARITLFENPEISLQYWEKAEAYWSRRDPKPFEDQLQYVQTLVVLGRLDEAWDRLLNLSPETPIEVSEYDYNLTKVSFLLGNFEHALEHGERMIRNRHTPIHRNVFFINICFRAPDPAMLRIGKERMRFLLENHDLITDQNLRELAALPNFPPDLREQVRDTLLGRRTDWEDQLDIASFEVRTELKSRERVLEELESQVDEKSLHQRIALALWCEQQGLTDNALQWADFSVASVRRDWFLIHLRLLGRLGEWDRVVQALRSEENPVDTFSIQILLTEAYLELGNVTRARRSWHRARLDGFSGELQTFTLLSLAQRMGMENEAAILTRELVLLGIPPHEIVVRLGLQALSRDSYELFYNMLKSTYRAFPKHPEVTNDWAYYALLMERNIDEATEAVARLSEAYPNRLRYHMTWSLGQLRKGHAREVLARLQHFKVDWMNLHPKWRLILASALSAVGEDAQAQAHVEDIDPDILNPWERELLTALSPRSN